MVGMKEVLGACGIPKRMEYVSLDPRVERIMTWLKFGGGDRKGNSLLSRLMTSNVRLVTKADD